MRHLTYRTFDDHEVTIDVPDDLLVRVANQIEAEPDLYDQGGWVSRTACGTAYCIGGWATTIAGLGIDFTGDVRAYVTSASSGSRVLPTMVQLTADLLGFTYGGAERLTSSAWQPREDLTVPEALRRLAVMRGEEGRMLTWEEVSEVTLAPSSGSVADR